MLKRNNISVLNKVNGSVNIEADKDLFVRVLSNIFSNTAKYGKLNGELIISSEIKQRADQQKTITIKFFNDGDPIPQEKHEAIFKKYTQANSTSPTSYH